MMKQNDAARVPNTDPSKNLKGFIEGNGLSALILSRLGLQSTPLTPETPLEELLENLESPEWTVRVAAARVLGQVRNEKAINYLVEALRDEKDAVRAAAARSLGAFGTVAPIEPLVMALKDESWEVRADAIEAIGQMKECAPITPFENALHDEDESVRLAAVQACRYLGKRAPFKALIQTFRSDSTYSIREAIILLLVELDEQERLLSLLTEEMDDPDLFRLVSFTLLQARSRSVPESAEKSLPALSEASQAHVEGAQKGEMQPTPSPRATIQIPWEEMNEQKSLSLVLSAPPYVFQKEEGGKQELPIHEADSQGNPWEADRIGGRLGPYELLRVLGQGSTSTVYMARHVLLEKIVAIKVLCPPAEASPFLQEARMLAGIRHSNIISFFDYGIENDSVYVVMEYIPRGDLRQLHPAGTQLELAQVANYVKQVSSALEYLHENRIVHCDVKPSNLLLSNSGEVLLCDFGIAMTLSDTAPCTTHLTEGTPSYMAPEQFQGRPVKASDQYALAIIAWEWLTGSRPFEGDIMSIRIQQLQSEPPIFQRKGAQIPQAIEVVLRKALRKDPSQRFSSVKAFAQALEVASKGEYRVERKPASALLGNFGDLEEQLPTIRISHPVPKRSLKGLSEQEMMIWRMRWLFAIVLSAGFIASGALSVAAFVSTGSLVTLGVIPILIVVFWPATSSLLPRGEKHLQLEASKQENIIQREWSMNSKATYTLHERS